MVAAMLTRWIETQKDFDAEGKEVLDIAIGSIGKFDLRGDATPGQETEARAIMEAFATETVTAALQSARLRKKARR